MSEAERLRIWITRAQPGAAATAGRVGALGHEAVVAPLLTLRRIPGVEIDLSGVGALAFTSANGARAFAEACPERSLRAFAVGAATAKAVKAAGFKDVLSSNGDVAALAAGIVARRREIKGAVLHAGAAEPACDLAGELAAHGLEARSVALYESAPNPPEDEEAQRLATLDVVLLHSPAAARVLAGVLKAHPAPQMRALGLSRAVVAPLSRVRLHSRRYAPIPMEAALLDLIGRR